MPSGVAVLLGGALGLAYGIIGLLFAGWLHRDENPPTHPVVFYLTAGLWPIPVAILVPLVAFRGLMALADSSWTE